VWRADFDIEDSPMLQDAKTETRKPVVFSPIRSSRTAANQILRMMGEGVRRQRKLPFFSETVGINCATVHFCGGRILARQQKGPKIKQTAAAAVPASLEPVTVETINATTPNSASQVIVVMRVLDLCRS